MICFNGKINGKALKFQAQRYKKIFLLAFIIPSLFMVIILGGINANLGIISIPVFIVLIPLLIIICPTKYFTLMSPNRVYIDLNDRTIVANIESSSEVFRIIDDIIEVKDHGEFYTFKFTSRRNCLSFIAQKSLIIHGTIEEFEAIFEDVLVRVN